MVEVVYAGGGTLVCCGDNMDLLEENTTDAAKEKPKHGEVVSVGDGKVLDDGTVRKLQVKKGDMVLFTSYAGTEVKIDGK